MMAAIPTNSFSLSGTARATLQVPKAAANSTKALEQSGENAATRWAMKFELKACNQNTKKRDPENLICWLVVTFPMSALLLPKREV